MKVHDTLGPGLLESVYKECMIHELLNFGFNVEVEKYVPINYKDKQLGNKLKLDILVQGVVIIELKSKEVLLPVFTSQLLTYMKLSKTPKGLLINFNSDRIAGNFKSYVNEYYQYLPEG